jgi:hypothetical protein
VLVTDPAALRFSYKLLARSGTQIDALFESERGRAAGSKMPSILVEGPAGTSGIAINLAIQLRMVVSVGSNSCAGPCSTRRPRNAATRETTGDPCAGDSHLRFWRGSSHPMASRFGRR